MICPYCGKENPETISLCNFCGGRLIEMDDRNFPQVIDPEPTIQTDAEPVKSIPEDELTVLQPKCPPYNQLSNRNLLLPSLKHLPLNQKHPSRNRKGAVGDGSGGLWAVL